MLGEASPWEAFGVLAAIVSPMIALVMGLMLAAASAARRDSARALAIAHARAYRWAQEESADLIVELARWVAASATDPSVSGVVQRALRLKTHLEERRREENGDGQAHSSPGT